MVNISENMCRSLKKPQQSLTACAGKSINRPCCAAILAAAAAAVHCKCLEKALFSRCAASLEGGDSVTASL